MTEEDTVYSTSAHIDENVNDAHDLKNVVYNRHDASDESIKYDMVDLVDPIRLAAVGDRFPYHTSMEGIVLYKKRSSEHTFLMLYWTILSPSSRASEKGELQTKKTLEQARLTQDPENRLVSCTEEEAFDFLYSLYGSNRNSDVTDEEIDQILKIYLPDKSIS
jgi:hypothetical protein